MLRSKTRRRVAAKTAAGMIGAGILLGAVPAIASLTAVAKPVTYTCTSASSVGTGNTYKMQMDLSGPLTPTPSATVVVTWKAGQPAMAPNLVAPAPIAAGDRIVIEADAALSGPLPTTTSIQSVLATATPGVVPVNGTLPPLPTVLVTVVPTATGVITVRPDAFSISQETGTGTGTETVIYDCVVANQTEATAAALLVTVKPTGATTGTPSTTPTTSTSPTDTGTPTPTETTPEPTVTITQTKTASPRKPGHVAETPGGGASTGGGGDAGPDARMFVLGGTAMIAAAGIGGLMLRRRTATRG